jgi:hypothetical protein
LFSADVDELAFRIVGKLLADAGPSSMLPGLSRLPLQNASFMSLLDLLAVAVAVAVAGVVVIVVVVAVVVLSVLPRRTVESEDAGERIR